MMLAACNPDDPAPRHDGGQPFEAARAMADVTYLATTIGPRVAGSGESEQAAAYIADQFSRATYGVLRSEFSYVADPNRPAVILVGAGEVTGATAGGSAVATVSGVASTAGSPSATGRIVVATRDGQPFAATYAAAVAAGAAGLVIVNNEPGAVAADLGRDATIPVVTAPGEAATALAEAVRAGATVSVTVTQPRLVSTSNILARAGAHSCVYILAAHYDTQPGSPGANDNASGVAVLLELARQLALLRPIPEVCFVAFGAKFDGSRGSAAFLDGLTSSGRPAYVIDVSGVGAGGGLAAYGDSTLQADFSGIAQRLGIAVSRGGATAPGATDTAVLRAAGIATLDVTRPSAVAPREDSAARVDERSIAEAGRIAGELARAISQKKR